MSVIPTPANTIQPVLTSSTTSCALANLDTLPSNVRPTLMTAKSNLVSTMVHAKIWWITIAVHARKVTKDSTVKTILMSAFHRRVPTMPRVTMFLAVIPASVHQDILESWHWWMPGIPVSKLRVLQGWNKQVQVRLCNRLVKMHADFTIHAIQHLLVWRNSFVLSTSPRHKFDYSFDKTEYHCTLHPGSHR